MTESVSNPVALLGFETGNLGDEVQSIAVSLHLPGFDRLLDRDRLAKPGIRTPHFLVAQSWFTNEWQRAPSSLLHPLFFGFCFGKPQMADGPWPDYLRARQPIGVRDPGSMERLAQHAVSTYWTGCLTLRIGRFVEPVPPEQREGTLLVDVSDKALETLPSTIRDSAEVLSNYAPQEILFDPLQRMAEAARRLDKLRRAKRVITSRLHAALPCVGFGVPVHLIVYGKESKRHRLSGFDRFVPVTYLGDDGLPDPDAFRDPCAVRIPEELEPVYSEFRNQLAATLGPLPETRYSQLHQRTRITFPNPGLGPRPGRVGVDLGMRIVERDPVHWDEERIVVDLESSAGFERARLPLLAGHPRSLGPLRRVRWKSVGPLCDLMASGQAT